MSTQQPRVLPGVPKGGEFAKTVHGESAVTLAAPAEHGEMAILQAVRSRNEAARALKKETTLIHLQGAVEALRRAFPDAAELRIVKERDGRGGTSPGFQATRLLDAQGNDATGGDKNWYFRGVEHGLSPATHLGDCEGLYEELDLAGYDFKTSELIVRLDRDYWKADQQ